MSEAPAQDNDAAWPWVGAAFSLFVCLGSLSWLLLGASSGDQVVEDVKPEVETAPADAFSTFSASFPFGAQTSIRMLPNPGAPEDMYGCVHVEVPRVAGSRAAPAENMWLDIAETEIRWQPTPFPNEALPFALATCARGWAPPMSRALLRALRSSGSWYAELPDRGILLVYSLPQNAAIRIDFPPSDL